MSTFRSRLSLPYSVGDFFWLRKIFRVMSRKEAGVALQLLTTLVDSMMFSLALGAVGRSALL